MKDPFVTLQYSLQSLFYLETIRNGKYFFPEIEHLRIALDTYDVNNTESFVELLASLKKAVPFILKWRIPLPNIEQAINQLAHKHAIAPEQWLKRTSTPAASPKFRFSALNHSSPNHSLDIWLTTKIGKPFATINDEELTRILIENQSQDGLSKRLAVFLEKHPDFLFNLIMKSVKNFKKIIQTRLILFLTDEQIARAIIQHIPNLTESKTNSFEQVEQLIYHLNDILSNGCSVSTLLRNTQAKSVLNDSVFFQIYQSTDYKNRSVSSGNSLKQ